ncbi:RNA polymerase sigma factor [Actinopolymorpha alba]|uniref:RNA polymerase sigma factor n=1 Tax=Actinopolymorpha alba TaxID=533267 RepID=UPI0003790846|nr:RNA polymerase sigma factor [Actinopolymorpha alba]
MTEASVASLVHAVRAGNREAFEPLYRIHVGAVQLAVRDHLRDPDRVADAVQETFARALASLDKLRDPERFRPWLLSIARHTAVDFRRNLSRITEDELDEVDVATPDNNDPAELAALRDVAAVVNGLVVGLSQRDAVALNLVTLGFEVADVAAALGIKHGAAKVVLHRARRRLRAALVLQLLSGGADTRCRELATIVEREGTTAAARHAESCSVCEESVRRALYG